MVRNETTEEDCSGVATQSLMNSMYVTGLKLYWEITTAQLQYV